MKAGLNRALIPFLSDSTHRAVKISYLYCHLFCTKSEGFEENMCNTRTYGTFFMRAFWACSERALRVPHGQSDDSRRTLHINHLENINHLDNLLRSKIGRLKAC